MEKEQTQKAPHPAWLRRVTRNPWVSFVCILATLVGFPLALLSIYNTSSPQLCLTETAGRLLIANTRGASGLELIHRGKRIDEPVMATQVVFWNAGNAPVKSADILSNIRLKMPPGCKPLEFTLLRTSRKEIGFTVQSVADDENSIELGWKILEENDGAVVQIIYVGEIAGELTVDGSVVGQKRIVAEKFLGTVIGSTPMRIGRFLFGLMWVSATVVYLFDLLRRIRSGEQMKWFREMVTVVSAIVLSIVIGSVWYLEATAPRPPSVLLSNG